MYRKIKSYKMDESELRRIWKEEYCKDLVLTFDGIKVRCLESMFDHIFFESSDRKEGDKSILSFNRLEKIYWIRDALQDKTAILKVGWNRKKKKYYEDRRLAIVKENYVVIIEFVGVMRARLITAYEKTDISIILRGPDFDRNNKYYKKNR